MGIDNNKIDREEKMSLGLPLILCSISSILGFIIPIELAKSIFTSPYVILAGGLFVGNIISLIATNLIAKKLLYAETNIQKTIKIARLSSFAIVIILCGVRYSALFR